MIFHPFYKSPLCGFRLWSHFEIHVAILEFYGRKEFHLMDEYGDHVLQRKTTITCLETARVVASKCPKDAAVRYFSRHIFRKNIHCSLRARIAFISEISENTTQLPVFTCSRKLLCVGYRRERDCKVISTLRYIRNKKMLEECNTRGGVLAPG